MSVWRSISRTSDGQRRVVRNILGANFSEAELLDTITQSRGEGMDAGLPPETRFLSGAVKSLLTRRANPDASDSGRPAIFFFGSVPLEFRGQSTQRRLLSQGIHDFTGKLWFVNLDASAGDFVEHDLDGEGLLSYASEDPELSQAATLLYLPSVGSSPLVFFAKGVANEEQARKEYDFAAVVLASPAETRAAIDRLHEQILETPNGMYGSTNLWSDGQKYKPVPHTEKVIQSLVRSAFIGAFPGIYATEEEMTEAGRFDIALVSHRPGTRTYLGLLELKVLRKTENADNSIAKGINQAFAYADKRRIPWAQLCCFDMREVSADDDPFVTHREKAKELEVLLERWFLHSTHDRYRDHVAAKQLAAS